MNVKHEKLSRLFCLAMILSVVLLAVSVVSAVTSTVIVRLLADDVVLTAVKVHNIVQYIVDYGLKIAVFAVLIAAATHTSSTPRANLLKIGGIVGVIGNALMMVMMLTGYVSDPHPAFEGWVSLLDMLSGNPIMQWLLPRVSSIATVLCTASFVFHASGTANFAAVLKIACTALSVMLGLFGITAGFFALVRMVIGLIAQGSSVVLYAALAKYYVAEDVFAKSCGVRKPSPSGEGGTSSASDG